MSTLRLRARLFWREYTRMRTAILFLIGILLIVLIGSFVPQDHTSAPTKVQGFLSDHGHLNQLGTHLGLPLTQVFVSPLFYVLLGSLYVALAACVIRRGRALVMRTVRRHPRSPQYWGEWGSWLFHTSFFLLLVAVVWGKSTGFEGIMTITEGQRGTETRSSFDDIQEGRLFDGQHAGYQVRLNSFHASYASTGAASDYVSNVTVVDHGRSVETRDVRVNQPLGYDGVEFYQQDYGWAPHIVVRNPAGAVVYDGSIDTFSSPDLGNSKSVQSGVVKVPDFGYTIPGTTKPVQMGIQLAVFPDARLKTAINPDGSIGAASTEYLPGGEQARNPVLQMQLYFGTLNATGTAQDVNTLDRASLVPYANGTVVPLAMGDTQRLPIGGTSAPFTISFPDLKQYSLFQVKKDDGVPLIYLTFVLIMTGLMVKLYIKPLADSRLRRRREARRGGSVGSGVADRGGGGGAAES